MHLYFKNSGEFSVGLTTDEKICLFSRKSVNRRNFKENRLLAQVLRTAFPALNFQVGLFKQCFRPVYSFVDFREAVYLSFLVSEKTDKPSGSTPNFTSSALNLTLPHTLTSPYPLTTSPLPESITINANPNANPPSHPKPVP